ncbi:MAG: histidine--tRNA ligase [Bacteroidetes bacterium GWE2_29_8]|nr:MAG: histidine--tRNA ligase [Bacteroidetes bacterium GWE2_29_8]OFY23603.1 MAG: histidine--tRNA ligase [Bacteroidetes bacterium GWF2_29_10]HBY21262.1 histidine--tRNA ligase [Clostridiales bacterium]
MATKPLIPKGTRDFNSLELFRRNYIFDNIKEVFKKYNYEAIETPSFELYDTLMGKYGEEGDKLIFKILNSGNFLEGVNDISQINYKEITTTICEKALRYDLTVPFARYVVMHQNEISFPFKRYQIQPVWRADKPQKGRYREFYQCDIDVIGSNSLLYEHELLKVIDEVFGKLGISVTVKLNNRKILTGIAEIIGEAERITDITTAIDKIDKIGIDKVKEELLSKGIDEDKFLKIRPFLEIKGSTLEKLSFLKDQFGNVEIGIKGIEELEKVFDYLSLSDLKNCKVELDISLARGLNYYTGMIYEVKANDVSIGSICGGGRYDNLTGIFGLKDVSGVGISFGADRIYDVLNELGKFPDNKENQTKVLITNLGEQEEKMGLDLRYHLIESGIKTELYHQTSKLKKQLEYANKRNIESLIIIGEEELLANKYTLKNMSKGEQMMLTKEEIIKELKK